MILCMIFELEGHFRNFNFSGVETPYHFTYSSPTTLPETALWARYEILNENTITIYVSDDSCIKQYGFNLESTLIENITGLVTVLYFT